MTSRLPSVTAAQPNGPGAGERPPWAVPPPPRRAMQSSVERAPLPALARVVRTVWSQRTGAAPYVQRHLPTGRIEIHFPIGGRPGLVGPLTARLTRDTGFAPACCVAEAVADHVAWRADNPR